MDLPLAQLALAAGRGAVGLSTLLAPGPAGTAFGLPGAADRPDAALVARLFGSRDLVLAGAVVHPSPRVRRVALQLGVAIDAIDVVSGLVEGRRGATRLGAVVAAGGAAAFVGLGVVGLRAADREGGAADG